MEKQSTIDQIIYRYRDSSVPPPHHRSYTITVSEKQSRKTVKDYSDVLSDDTHSITSEDWQHLLKQSQSLQKEGRFVAEGATGTSGNTIELKEGEKVVYQLYWDSLSKDKIKAATLAFKDAIHATTEVQ